MLIRTLFLLGAVAMLLSALIAGSQAAANVVLHRKALVAMRAASLEPDAGRNWPPYARRGRAT